MKKEKLIKSICVAINALEKDTVFYDWDAHSSCNCGVVSQAVLGIRKDNLSNLIAPMNNAMDEANKERKKKGRPTIPNTWKSYVQHFCDITGKSEEKIFVDLFNAGLSSEDICHLEYLENPAILERAKIDKKKNYFAEKGNLIKYLKAWVEILKEETPKQGLKETPSTKTELQEELLRAEANQEFEECAKLRDAIAVMA